MTKTQELVKMLKKAIDWIEDRKKSDIIESVQNTVNIDTDTLRTMSLDELTSMKGVIQRLKPSFISGSPMTPMDAKTSERQKLDNMFSTTMDKLKRGEKI